MSDEPRFKYGDRVQIITHTPAVVRGRVIELRGPLGPGGGQVYKVLLRRRPYRSTVEVREDQLVLLPPKPAAP